jgi:hypothetical protein
MPKLDIRDRAPLHSIESFAQLLDDGAWGTLTCAERQNVRHTQANERHVLSLANAVIGFARWDATEALALPRSRCPHCVEPIAD